MLDKVRLADKLAHFEERWSPRIVGEVNGAEVKVVKLEGEFVWHHHEAEDELFLVLSGRLRMRVEYGDVVVEPGEFIIVPRGVEHCPVAEPYAEVMLFEPKGTLNTGNLVNDRTVADPERI